MRSATWVSCAAIVAVLWGGQPCSAGFDNALFSLGAATLTTDPKSGDTIVKMDVYLTLTNTANPTYQASLFGIDVTKSTAALSPRGNYSAWNFTPDTTVLQSSSQGGWGLAVPAGGGDFQYADVPNKNPKTGLNFSFQFGLSDPSQPYHLGYLSYDVTYAASHFNLTVSSSDFVDITGTNPIFGSQADPAGHLSYVYESDPANYAQGTYQDSVSFGNGQEMFPGGQGGMQTPAPSGLILAGLGSALLIGAHVVRRRPTQCVREADQMM